MVTGSGLVSIILPAYNVAEIVDRAIYSALSQTYGNVEVILVDDASQDDTAAIGEGIAVRDSRLRVLRRSENGGPGVSRNVALDAARGEWIAVLDADDTLLPERIRRLLAVAEENTLDVVADNLDLIDPGLRISTGNAFLLAEGTRIRLTPERFAAHTVPGGRVMLGWAKPLVRRRFLRDNNLRWRALRHAEDFLFLMEMLLCGAKAELTGWAGYRYMRPRNVVTGATSAFSRAQRSSADQNRAIDILLREYDDVLTPQLRKVLAARPAETLVTTAVLDMCAALRGGRLFGAMRFGASAVSRPRALSRCLVARYGPGAGHITD